MRSTRLLTNGKQYVAKIEENIVRHAYGEALSRTARLAAYGEAGETKIESYEVSEKQSQLALDDLVHLAISLRRLSEAAGIYGALQGESLPLVQIQGALDAFTVRTVGAIKLVDVINRLIHSRYVSLLNYTFETDRSSDIVTVSNYFKNRHKYRVQPICFVRSDVGDTLHFQVADFCSGSAKLLDTAADACQEQKIFLEQFL
jgi:hypothetical protein